MRIIKDAGKKQDVSIDDTNRALLRCRFVAAHVTECKMAREITYNTYTPLLFAIQVYYVLSIVYCLLCTVCNCGNHQVNEGREIEKIYRERKRKRERERLKNVC